MLQCCPFSFIAQLTTEAAASTQYTEAGGSSPATRPRMMLLGTFLGNQWESYGDFHRGYPKWIVFLMEHLMKMTGYPPF